MNNLQEACIQFHLPVEPELLCQLVDYCDTDKDGMINYLDFANFLNWKDKMPTGLGLCDKTSMSKDFLVCFLFYGPSTHFRSFRAQSVTLTTLILGKPAMQFTST